jgi:hypothetical protein
MSRCGGEEEGEVLFEWRRRVSSIIVRVPQPPELLQKQGGTQPVPHGRHLRRRARDVVRRLVSGVVIERWGTGYARSLRITALTGSTLRSVDFHADEVAARGRSAGCTCVCRVGTLAQHPQQWDHGLKPPAARAGRLC